MALYIAHDEQGLRPVSDLDPIQTRHNANGDAFSLPLYLCNDGKRTQDGVTPLNGLIYTNLSLQLEGVSHVLQGDLAGNADDITLYVDSGDGWDTGTIVKVQDEFLYIEKKLSEATANDPASFQVIRAYQIEGEASDATPTPHYKSQLLNVTAYTGSVSLALPPYNDYAVNKTQAEIESIIFTNIDGGVGFSGIDPSILTVELTNTSYDLVKTNAYKYKVGSLIKIDDEIMKITDIIDAQTLRVIRNYRGTASAHAQNSLVYCDGLVDVTDGTTNLGHLFWLKNDPPANLPTQKKQDIRIVIEADEEPL